MLFNLGGEGSIVLLPPSLRLFSTGVLSHCVKVWLPRGDNDMRKTLSLEEDRSGSYS